MRQVPGLRPRIEQDRPVHGFVAEYAGRCLGQFTVMKHRHRAHIRQCRAMFQSGGETQHIGLIALPGWALRITQKGTGIPHDYRF